MAGDEQRPAATRTQSHKTAPHRKIGGDLHVAASLVYAYRML